MTRARRWHWPLVAALAAAAFLYRIDGLYIPHIGDEAPYIEIARLTAESGSWLPLRTAAGLENTKPPLLFWLGIVSTGWGESFELVRLRLPVVLFTFATAGLTAVVSRKLGSSRETAWIAALTYLGFYSSFQYGRPFLTNSPETFFVFLSFALALLAPNPWVLSGLALGIGCLFKSFALVAPLGLALLWVAGRRSIGKVALSVGIALAVFGLWPLLDPDPASVVRHFVLEENLGKLESEGYLTGMVRGPYALQWLWLGHFGNAGLFAVPLLFLVVAAVRERKTLPREERSLWILVLSFLLVYSLPSQRQENYLLPTVPALAILLARRWDRFPEDRVRWFALPGAAFAAILAWVVLSMRSEVLPAGSYRPWQLAAIFSVLLLWILVIFLPRAGRRSFHALVFASFFLLAIATAPFEGPLGRFDPDRVAFLEGRRVFVPSEFVSRHERHRFLLPGVRVEGYDPADADTVSRLLQSGRPVIVHRAPGEGIEGPFRVIDRRLDLRTRQTKEEMWRIVFRRELDLLVRQEILVRRFTRDRMDGDD